MRKANVITALALTVVMLAAMTGIAAATTAAIKKGGRNTKRIFVLLLIVGIIASLTPAVQAGQKVLWVIPDNPTSYSAENDDDYILDNTVISDVYLGSSFSSNVTVLLKASVGNPPEEAELVYLKFFVETAEDASYIQNITIGTAIRIYPHDTNVDPNPNSTGTPATLTFTDVDRNHPVPAGYGVEYLIGDIPFYDGGDIGNPNPNENEGPFNPDNAENCYIRVPFTINFDTTPYAGFTLYIYAGNDDTDVKTAYSHDGGITHVPEFATLAIPMIIAILSGLFFLNHRKRREE